MASDLTFVIPVRHPENARNWEALKSNLTDTARSIANQDASGWQAFVVANRGADIPKLPDGFQVVDVDFPPNPVHEFEGHDVETVLDRFRADKGRRVLAGLIAARPQGHVMIVDDDDFVSARLARFVAENSSANGWVVDEGYAWTQGGPLIYRTKGFSSMCGTSHIVRADLYESPDRMELATDEYIKFWLGSHRHIESILAGRGFPLVPLPFPGAIYRVGHPTSHGNSKGLLRQYIPLGLLMKPLVFAQRVCSLRAMSKDVRREFCVT